MAKKGRPSVYEKQIQPHLDDIRKAVESGATVEEIAKAFNLSASTIYKYKAEKKEFSDAFAHGREKVVIEIKGALLKKALGFHYIEERTTAKKDKDGENIVMVENYKRYCPPSETAARMLLNNYDSNWRDQDNATASLKKQEMDLKKAIAESNNFDLNI